MWRAFRDAGRPWPTLSDDDVVDYMVMEAVALRVREEDRQAEKDRTTGQWKQDTEHLKNVV